MTVPDPWVAHSLVWEAEKLAEKYILIEMCSDRGLYSTHPLERGMGWGVRELLAESLDLALKDSRQVLF